MNEPPPTIQAGRMSVRWTTYGGERQRAVAAGKSDRAQRDERLAVGGSTLPRPGASRANGMMRLLDFGPTCLRKN